jgi:hypothetical protein
MSGSGASGVILIRAVRVTAAGLALAGVLTACSASHPATPTPTPTPTPTTSAPTATPTPTPSASPTQSADVAAALAIAQKFQAYYFKIQGAPSSYTVAGGNAVAVLPALDDLSGEATTDNALTQAWRGTPPVVTFTVAGRATTTVKTVTFNTCQGPSKNWQLYNLKTNAVIDTAGHPAAKPPWPTTYLVVQTPDGWRVAQTTTNSNKTCTP